MSRAAFKAVCYRCSYEGHGTASTRCPTCQFPLILESENTPPGGHRIEEIFARGSIADGAPPLPGVHGEPRQARLQAEARRRRIEEVRAQRAAPTTPPVLRAADLPVGPSRALQAFKFTALCASALAAGVAAAVLQGL